MNNGLKDELKIAYPNIIQALRPEISLSKNIDPFLLAGFTEAVKKKRGIFFFWLF